MKKVLFVIIAILLAVVIFFCGVLVTKNTQNSIVKQTEEVTKQATETSSDNGYITTKDHLSEMNSIKYVTKDMGYLTATTSSGGQITKTYTASDLGVSKIVGISEIGTETLNTKYVVAGHNGSIDISDDGATATVKWYVSFGGMSVKCNVTLVCVE
jgi:uncharacterized protein YxeA